MAKITLENGMVIEGTIEELKQMGVKFEEELKVEPLKVGDYAKVIDEPDHYQYGTIVKIVDFGTYPGYFDTENLDGTSGDIHFPNQLFRATDKEISEAKAEITRKEIEVKWAKIGRKPNEFKVGDAVRYKKAFTIVTEVKPDGIVAINQSNHISKNIEVSAEDLALEFPAEARFE
jgi:hypothetical protein